MASAPHRVVVLALPGVIPFELSIPHRIFGRAYSPAGDPLYTVTTCTAVPGRVATEADFELWVEHGPEALAEADTVIVPAAYQPAVLFREGRLPDELAGIFASVRPGVRMASICTGGFFLAAAGFLDGRPATTHWSWTEQFQRLFPTVRVDPNVLYVDDGEVLTSAGVAAGVDLCVHMVRRDHGSAVANDVARRSVVPPHRDGGQAQYIRRPVPEPRFATTSAARGWALGRLHQPIQLRDLAEQESMSVRTFTRRFREEVGVSPGQWLTQQRVERARHLLESTELSVDRVARDAGFRTAQSMRQHLQSALGVPPTVYRRTFRSAGDGEAGSARSVGEVGSVRAAGAVGAAAVVSSRR
ncbi:GlxA family transcriptional regulator [Streptomyces sp. NPDC020141]|uniref:GlxA family transcriptional regulator n=1 Tax=Streptomyces sp. NPDC020141 TaxID=3365065 RepID=UPI0037AA2495